MPLQNRVTLLSTIEAAPERGLFMGNRGRLHDNRRRLVTTGWRSRAWLSGAPGWERFATKWMPGLAGAVIIEAAKQLYGAKPVKAPRRGKPVLVPLPNVATGRIVPLRRDARDTV